MNSNLLKKLLAGAMTGLFLISMGASAVGASAVGASAVGASAVGGSVVAARTADTQSKCEARGGTWNPKTKKCSDTK